MLICLFLGHKLVFSVHKLAYCGQILYELLHRNVYFVLTNEHFMSTSYYLFIFYQTNVYFFFFFC